MNAQHNRLRGGKPFGVGERIAGSYLPQKRKSQCERGGMAHFFEIKPHNFPGRQSRRDLKIYDMIPAFFPQRKRTAKSALNIVCHSFPAIPWRTNFTASSCRAPIIKHPKESKILLLASRTTSSGKSSYFKLQANSAR